MYEDIIYEVDDPVAVIRFNRPDKLNAFTYPMLAELKHAIATAEDDPAVVGIVITGEGRGFSAGMDMQGLGNMVESGSNASDGTTGSGVDLSADPGKDLGENFKIGFTYLMAVRKPIVAAVNGPCAGLGMSIALMCDIRFAGESSRMLTTFAERGLIAEHGQAWILPRVVGPSKALDLLFTNRRVGAAEALDLGLVNFVVPDEELVDAAINYVKDLGARTAPSSLMHMKHQVYRHLNMSLHDSQMETEKMIAESMKTDAFAEGVASFVEKRPPNFKRVTSKD